MSSFPASVPGDAWAIAEANVRAALVENDASHDFAHIDRVIKNARTIACAEGISDTHELFVIELGALLHDISDFKYSGSDTSGAEAAEKLMVEAGIEAGMRAEVIEIVNGVSFSHELRAATEAGGSPPRPLPRAVAIVQDADRLDAIGAIGIARTFTFGGVKGRPLHDPLVPPRSPEQLTMEAYR
jgi:uncharacterized protein